ncbi:MAG TPA: sigma factor [Bacillota bacterium]|nr:sigma factor [Bacillota bacterium]
MEREQHPVVRAIIAEYRSLLRYAERLVSGLVHCDAEDVVQDVMVRLLSLPVNGIPIERLASYLRASVRNRMSSRRNRMSMIRRQPSLSDIGGKKAARPTSAGWSVC